MKLLDLDIKEGKITLSHVLFDDEHLFFYFLKPLEDELSTLAFTSSGVKKGYYKLLNVERGIYLAYSHTLLSGDYPAHMSLYYDEDGLYFTNLTSFEDFCLFYGYVLASLLSFERLANVIACFYYIYLSTFLHETSDDYA
jgi:hypothetical protein